jgi:RNA polymerase sigma-70 factor (ECF subfamily)
MVGMSGERPAFERMFRAHHAAVYRYVLRRVEEPAVEDIVGETFLVAWRRFAELDGEPRPWLLGIARRVCANHLRGRARRTELRARLAAEPAPTAAAAGDLVDRSVLAALASLRDADREVIALIAWDDLDNRRAAKVLGCGVGAFAVRLHRARRRLARALDDGAAERPPANTESEAEVAHELP